MKHPTCFLPGIFLLMLFVTSGVGAEPLQTDLFVVVKPQGLMGKSPLYPVYRVADRTDPFAAKIYDTIEKNPRVKEVLQLYQRSQMESMKKYRAQLVKEGKSTTEIDRLLREKTKPIPLVVKDGKTTPFMSSGSAFIQTMKNGKLDTDFQYVCPKVSITKGWEGFSSKPGEPFSEYEEKEFLNLIAHEVSHANMKETYGFVPRGINPIAALGHWEGKMTTPQLAFTEGYAEFMGAWYSGSESMDNISWNKDGMTGLPKTERENKKTEGVVAAIFWDIAKGEGEIQNGMEKIQNVLRDGKAWTIEGFAKDFKRLYPNDAGAIDRLMKENLIPEKDSLAACWVNLRSAGKSVDLAQKSAKNLSFWRNPIKKIKAWWRLWKAKRLYGKLLSRYQSIYGYEAKDLTAPDFPKKQSVETTTSAQQAQPNPAAPIEQANPFSGDAVKTR